MAILKSLKGLGPLSELISGGFHLPPSPLFCFLHNIVFFKPFAHHRPCCRHPHFARVNSDVFVPNQASGESEAQEADLAICDRNRRGAKENPEVTRDLLQKELDEGWLEEVPSEEAQECLKHLAVVSSV